MPELPRDTEVVSSDSVAAKKLDNTLQHIGKSREDRPPRGTDLPLKPGRNYLNTGTNFVRSPKGE